MGGVASVTFGLMRNSGEPAAQHARVGAKCFDDGSALREGDGRKFSGCVPEIFVVNADGQWSAVGSDDLIDDRFFHATPPEWHLDRLITVPFEAFYAESDDTRAQELDRHRPGQALLDHHVARIESDTEGSGIDVAEDLVEVPGSGADRSSARVGLVHGLNADLLVRGRELFRHAVKIRELRLERLGEIVLKSAVPVLRDAELFPDAQSFFPVRFIRSNGVEGQPQDPAISFCERRGHHGQFVRRFFGRDVSVLPERQLEIQANLIERLRHLLGRVFQRAAVAPIEKPFFQESDGIRVGSRRT